MDIDYTAYLQGSLVLDSDGCWWHEGVKFKNEKLANYFHKSIKLDPNDGEFYVVIGRQRARFTYHDTALFVFNLNPQLNTLTLNNNELLSIEDVNFVSNHLTNAMYVEFVTNNIHTKAKISRSCYQSITAFVTSDNCLSFGPITKKVTVIN